MECVVFVFSALLLGGMSGQPGIFTRESAYIPAKCNQLPGLRWVGGHFTKNTGAGIACRDKLHCFASEPAQLIAINKIYVYKPKLLSTLSPLHNRNL